MAIFSCHFFPFIDELLRSAALLAIKAENEMQREDYQCACIDRFIMAEVLLRRVNRSISAILLLGFISPFGLAAQTTISPSCTLRAGAILPLTGRAASVGVAIRNGMALAYEELPDDVRGRLQIFFEDDHNEPQKTVAAARKMAAEESADIFINTSAQPAMALAPVAEDLHTPLISISAPRTTVEGRKYSVLFLSTAEKLAAAMVDEAKARNYTRIVRISSIHEGRLQIKKAFDALAEGSFDIAIDDEVQVGETDFRSFLARVRAAPQVDAIYVNLFLGQIGIFARQAREQHIALPLFTSEFFDDPGEVKAAQGALSGQWYAVQKGGGKDFIDKYVSRFPDSYAWVAANGHDIVLLLAQALKGCPGREELNRFLHNVEGFKGSLGILSAAGDNTFDIPVEVRVVP